MQNFPYRKIFVADEGKIKAEQQRAVRDIGEALKWRIDHGKIEHCGKCHIAEDSLQIVWYRVLDLPDKVAEEHAGGIACESAPGTCHIAVVAHENHIDQDQDYASGDAE